MIYIVSVNNFIYACSNFQVFFKANNSVPHWNTNFQVVYIKQCTYIHACLVTQLYLTLCNPLDCRRPDSSVYGIFQARILKGVASSFSRDLPDPGIKPASPVAPALAGGFFTTQSKSPYTHKVTNAPCPLELCAPFSQSHRFLLWSWNQLNSGLPHLGVREWSH